MAHMQCNVIRQFITLIFIYSARVGLAYVVETKEKKYTNTPTKYTQKERKLN